MNWDSLVNSDADAISPTQITGFRYSDGWARNQKVYFAHEALSPCRPHRAHSYPIHPEQGPSR